MKEQKTEVDAALDDAIKSGLVEITGFDKKGDRLFQLTKAGRDYVDNLLKESPGLFIEMGLDRGLH